MLLGLNGIERSLDEVSLFGLGNSGEAGELSETAVDGKVVPFGLDNDKGTG